MTRATLPPFLFHVPVPRRRWRPVALAAACAAAWLHAPAASAQGQPAAPEDIGTVVVSGTRQRTAEAAGQAQMREADALTTGAALELVPGVAQSKVGARNEQMVFVRGFDLRQVPVFIDGVPVYVPYDGYADLGRFNTFDLARVEVEKGYSSLLYGANTLGGAINLVGRRPAKALELDAGAGLATDRNLGPVQSWWSYANLGTRREDWYAQLSASHLVQDAFSLPGGFAPAKAEDGGVRDNSDLHDRKVALKLGWTPRAGDEYTLNLIDQHGAKGTPPYAGGVASVTPRFWRWPYWDKRSAYLLSRTSFGEHVLKLRVFRDTFKNSLYAYDDASYATQKKPSSFQSWYDDYTDGASAQVDLALTPADTLGLAAHWKKDVHREHNAGEPIRRFEDVTTSLAAEHSHRFSPLLALVAGAGRDTRDTRAAQDYNGKTGVVSDFARGDGSATNAQLALLLTPSAQWQARLSLARKSRFPTIKDRYSYRMGTALPNADLRPEHANHVELGVSGRAAPGLQLDAAVFRSRITDLIQSVSVGTPCGTTACLQAQNIGRARAQGLELGFDWRLGALLLDGHYQFLDRDNLSSPAVLLTDTPRQQALLHAAWLAVPGLTLHANLKAATQRWSTSDGLQRAAGFGVVDLKAQWQASALVSLEAGVHNAGDRLYAYAEGFPEPGRQWFLQGRLSWQ